MTVAVRILRLANRLLPAPALPGDADPVAYARWEYETSDAVLRLWDRAGRDGVRDALDVGCGLGGKTHRLREHAGPGVRWAALDIDEQHLRQAGTYFEHAGVEGLPRVAGDAGRLPFADASFDRIVTADALEHLPDPRRALREFRRCVRDDGRLVLLFNPWASPRGSHLGDVLHLPWCQLLFTRDQLREATLAIAEDRARSAPPDEAEAVRAYGRDLVDHFEHHVHPTRIADLRVWLDQDETFTLEHELRIGPGPIGSPGWLQAGWCEEWLSATYGAVLRPRTARASRSSTRTTAWSSS